LRRRRGGRGWCEEGPAGKERERGFDGCVYACVYARKTDTPLMKDEPFGYPLTDEGNERERWFRINDVAS
jgi:hypothetical protein